MRLFIRSITSQLISLGSTISSLKRLLTHILLQLCQQYLHRWLSLTFLPGLLPSYLLLSLHFTAFFRLPL